MSEIDRMIIVMIGAEVPNVARAFLSTNRPKMIESKAL